jgi:hypothetical protein
MIDATKLVASVSRIARHIDDDNRLIDCKKALEIDNKIDESSASHLTKNMSNSKIQQN